MKVLLTEKTTQYNSAVETLTEKMTYVQAALDAYALLGLAAAPTTADLPELWESPKLFLERMLTGGGPVTLSGGLAVEPGKVYDLLQKPAGTEDFLLTVDGLRGGSSPAYWNTPGIDITLFELAAGVLRIRPAVLDSLKESYRIYATTQQQVDEWTALQAIAAQLESIRQSGRYGARFEAPEFLKKALLNSGQADQFSPVRANAEYVAGQHR